MPQDLKHILEIITSIIELLGVSILIVGFLISTIKYFKHYRNTSRKERIEEFKDSLGRTILVGLEIIVAATIVRTVTVEASLSSVGLLAGMIAVRTLINWTISTELNGHWPWINKTKI